MYEIEVQNETTQSQQTLRFVAVPRIGEGVRLQDRNGFWTSFDVLDVWYQRSAYGDVWIPYMHVRQSEGVAGTGPGGPAARTASADADTEGDPETGRHAA